MGGHESFLVTYHSSTLDFIRVHEPLFAGLDDDGKFGAPVVRVAVYVLRCVHYLVLQQIKYCKIKQN